MLEPRVSILLVAALFCAALSVPTAMATSFFVSPEGDDASSGLSIDEPRRTIKTTLMQLAAGDTLNLLDGNYDVLSQGPSNMTGFQLPADRVVLRAWPDAAATIDWSGVALDPGDRFLNGWNSVDSGAIEGIRFANWSNDTFFIYVSAGDSLRIEDCHFDAVSPLDGNAVIFVSAVRGVSIAGCTFTGRSAESRFYAIDLRGDGEDTVEGYLVEGCSFNDESALAADTLGWSAGVLAIQVDGLVVRGCIGYNAGHDSDMDGRGDHLIGLFDADDVLIEDLELKRYLFGKSQSSWVHNANGIEIARWSGDPSERVRIEGCRFWGAGHGIEVGNNSVDVDISYVWCDSTYDDCIFFDDGASSSSARFVVSHYSQDNGIDFQGTGIDVSRCTIVRPKNAALNVTHLASDVSIDATLVYDVRDPATAEEIVIVGDGASDVQIDYCMYFDPDGNQTAFKVAGEFLAFPEWQQAGFDAHGIWGDPLFCDESGRAWPFLSQDFRLAAGSPAIGSGPGGVSIGALESGCGLVSVDPGDGVSPRLAWLCRNPVRSSFWLEIADPTARDVVVSIHDIAGRSIRRSAVRLVDGRVTIPATDVGGRPLAPGVYFVSVDGGEWRQQLRSVVIP